MGPRAGSLTLLVGRGTFAAGVRQALEDFAALGLVRDIIWIDADRFHHADSPVGHLRVNTDGTPVLEQVSLTTALATADADHASLGLINTTFDPNGTITASEISTITLALDSVGYSSKLHRSNIMLAPVDAPAPPTGTMPLLRGYVNLMLAPEDSIGPDVPSAVFKHGQDEDHYTLHCAAGIASIYGAWVGSGGIPVQHMEQGQGDSFRLVRAYYRRIDGQNAQRQIKTGIFSTKHNPRPKLNRPGQPVYAQYPQDPRAFNQTCAEELIDEYEHTLTGEHYQTITTREIADTNTSAMAEFAHDYATNLLHSPQRFLYRVRAFHNPELPPLGEKVLAARSAKDEQNQPLGDFSPRGVSREEVAAELEPLWTSYEHMALTMLDAAPRPFGSRSSEPRYPVASREQGSSTVFVAPSSESVIPGPSVRFGADLPPQLKNLMGKPIAAYDVFGAANYERQLAQLSGSQHRAIGRAIGDFRQWREQHSYSFAARVGALLHSLRDRVKAEREGFVQQAAALQQRQRAMQVPDRSVVNALRFAGWVCLSSLLLFLSLWLVGCNVVDEAGSLSWLWVRALNAAQTSTVVLFLGVWVLLWVLLFGAQVAVETRDEMLEYRRLVQIKQEIVAARENAAACDVALARIDIAYRQFVSVSHLLGSVLERPFGTIGVNTANVVTPSNTMPHAVVLAEAAPPEDAIRQVVERYRMSIFEERWLASLATDAKLLAASLLHRRNGVSVPVEHLYASPGEGSGSPLERMAELMASPEFIRRDRSTDRWREVATKLADARTTNQAEHPDGVHDVYHPVTVIRDGRRTQAPKVAPLPEVKNTGTFNGQFLTEVGQTMSGAGRIERALYTRGSSAIDAIGGGEVLVQVSAIAHDQDIRIQHTTANTPPKQPQQLETNDNPFANPNFFTDNPQSSRPTQGD